MGMAPCHHLDVDHHNPVDSDLHRQGMDGSAQETQISRREGANRCHPNASAHRGLHLANPAPVLTTRLNRLKSNEAHHRRIFQGYSSSNRDE